MSDNIINIANDFTRYPAGRVLDDGLFSGEKFRTSFLVPILERDESAIIELDGTRGYGSSFLEEAFGGLVRLGYSPEKILSTFEIRSSDKSLIFEIESYIKQAGEE